MGLGALGLLVVFIMNRKGVTRLTPYVIMGFFIWACVLKSGVHATLAGVALGFLIPLNIKNEEGESPLMVMEHGLQPLVNFWIMPIFAFANAGVSLAGLGFKDFLDPVTLGIVLGLVVGKPLGVMGVAFIAIKLKLCHLPYKADWAQFFGMALLTGIGFTMSLFIGTLAFTDVEYTTAVRLGVLTGSTLSALLGVMVLILSTKKPEEQTSSHIKRPGQQADEPHSDRLVD